MSASEHVRTTQHAWAARGQATLGGVRRAIRRRGPVVRRRLLVADILALACSFVVVDFAGYGNGVYEQLAAFALAMPLWLAGAAVIGLYAGDAQKLDHSTVDELGNLFLFVTLAAWLSVAASWVFGFGWSTGASVTFWVAAAVVTPIARVLARALARRSDGYVQNTLIVGAGDVGQLVGRKVRQHPELGIRLVGFVDADPKSMRADLDGVPVLGSPADIAHLVDHHDVQRVIVSFSNERHEQLLGLIHGLRELNVHIDLVPRLFEAVGPVAAIHDVEGLKLLTLPPVRSSRVARATKRAADVVVASTLLVVFGPYMLYVGAQIRRGSPGPALFRQQRLGEGMRPFEVLKFRTMVVDADDAPHREYVASIMDLRAAPTGTSLYKLERPDAVTKIGARLRRTSLDELPQLINVVRGEMSLVGPRPCLPYETAMFEPHHFDRFLVPAGMTGLWQVSARANSTFREALDLDATYAHNWSLGLDLRLLVRTPLAVLRGRKATS